jgi:hypothetical protein
MLSSWLIPKSSARVQLHMKVYHHQTFGVDNRQLNGKMQISQLPSELSQFQDPRPLFPNHISWLLSFNHFDSGLQLLISQEQLCK